MSRFLLQPKQTDAGTTFVPTMKKLGFPFVALDEAGHADWKHFQRNCEGMRMQDILLVCEDDSRLAALEKEFRKQSVTEFPQRVMFGYEKPAEKC